MAPVAKKPHFSRTVIGDTVVTTEIQPGGAEILTSAWRDDRLIQELRSKGGPGSAERWHRHMCAVVESGIWPLPDAADDSPSE